MYIQGPHGGGGGGSEGPMVRSGVRTFEGPAVHANNHFKITSIYIRKMIWARI